MSPNFTEFTWAIRMTFEVNLEWYTHTPHSHDDRILQSYWLNNTKLIKQFSKLFWSLQSLKSHNSTQIECGCGETMSGSFKVLYTTNRLSHSYMEERVMISCKKDMQNFVCGLVRSNVMLIAISLRGRIALKWQHLSSTHQKQLGSSEWISLR